MDVNVAPPPPNPWLSIWREPRLTIRRIADAEEQPNWWPVVILAAICQGIASLQSEQAGSFSLSMSAMPVIIGMLQVVFGVLVGPFLLAFTGGWMGGEADPADIRHAIAWSYVPFVAGAAVWAPLTLAYPTPPQESEVAVPLAAAVIASLALVVTGVWSFVAQVITLSEVQRFSVWKALASMLILLVPILILGML